MSIMLQDKIEAVYELKRYTARKLDRSDRTMHELMDALLRNLMNENKRLAVHVVYTRMTNEQRVPLLANCPTVAKWVQQ
jgi:ferredoxin-thioredoxin reductase catalytic subunit